MAPVPLAWFIGTTILIARLLTGSSLTTSAPGAASRVHRVRDIIFVWRRMRNEPQASRLQVVSPTRNPSQPLLHFSPLLSLTTTRTFSSRADMAHPLDWPGAYYFYPIGNTSAISLTRDLPPEDPANMLLLGCGDARNVLYTIYCEPEHGA